VAVSASISASAAGASSAAATVSTAVVATATRGDASCQLLCITLGPFRLGFAECLGKLEVFLLELLQCSVKP